MLIVVPMAGSGQRFDDAGYKELKPLIRIRGKRMIEYVCDMFDKDFDEFVFIVSVSAYRKGDVQPVLQKYVKNCTILSVADHHKGPVWTVWTKAIPFINSNEPVIIVHCDTPMKWDYKDFLEYSKYKDGVLVSNVGFHPHSLASTLMAFSRTDADGRVMEVKEKSSYTSNHFKEHASAGLYYFKKGSYVKDYFEKALEYQLQYNGEFYVTLVYNLLIKDGLDIYSYPVPYVLGFGTPQEVRNYEAWQVIIEGGQVRNERDLLGCYQYWKDAKDFTPGEH